MAKNTESAGSLALDKERYRFLVEHSGELISSHRPGDWAYTAASPAIESLSGFTQEEVMGRSAYDFFHPEDAEAMKKKLIPAIYRQGIRTFRYRHLTKSGEYQWVESTHRSIRDKDTGELKEIISVTRDITPQIEAEQALREQQAQLAHMSRLLSLGEMASGLAHEINQPLATTLNYANGALRLLQRDGEIPRDKLQSVLESIVKQAQRAAEIVKRLRGLVRKTSFQRAPINLKELCDDVIHFMQHELFENSIEATVTVASSEDTDLIAEVDRVQIEQVLVNLLKNAIEAYQSRQKPRAPLNKIILITLSHEQDSVLLKVKDFAGGITTDIQSTLFEPYATSKAEGLGMGLSISRSIVEAHGGQINVDSDGESTTEFTIKLPLHC